MSRWMICSTYFTPVASVSKRSSDASSVCVRAVACVVSIACARSVAVAANCSPWTCGVKLSDHDVIHGLARMTPSLPARHSIQNAQGWCARHSGREETDMGLNGLANIVRLAVQVLGARAGQPLKVLASLLRRSDACAARSLHSAPGSHEAM